VIKKESWKEKVNDTKHVILIIAGLVFVVFVTAILPGLMARGLL